MCARLSGDAAKVQGATGARVGSVLQGIAGKVQGTTGARVETVLQGIAGKVQGTIGARVGLVLQVIAGKVYTDSGAPSKGWISSAGYCRQINSRVLLELKLDQYRRILQGATGVKVG